MAFQHRYRELQPGNGARLERTPVKHCQQNMWVLKPASLNQGRGIEVSRNMREITDIIQKKKDTSWVIQKYIEKPLLYNTRKFDIRVWVIVKDDFSIYFYK